MNNHNYITVSGWMVNELGLTGRKLLAYAIIHGFSSQDNNQYFMGSHSYICDFLKITKKTSIKILKELEEDELIKKQSIPHKGNYRNAYIINEEKLRGVLFSNEGVITTPERGVITTPKNNNIDIQRKIEMPMVPEWPLWKELWQEWIDFRKREKKPSFKSIKTEQIAFNKLYKLANGDINTARKIVENSTTNNYSGLFPLKNSEQNERKKETARLAGFGSNHQNGNSQDLLPFGKGD